MTTRLALSRWAGPLLIGVALALCFHEAVLSYARDSYYQSHFVFLWLFFGAALWRARSRAVPRAPWRSGRTWAGLALVLVAAGLLHVGLVTGSTTVRRLALVATFGALALLAMRGWSARRCLAYTAFALLCFGIPYSAYFQLTRVFRATFFDLLVALPRFTWLDYRVEGLTLVFGDGYRMAVTADCSGFNQLVTFAGLAFLGSLTGRPSAKRTLLLFGTGALLAYGANLARVLLFVGLVDLGVEASVENDTLHAALGLIAYAPFIALFLWVILRTHRPLELRPPPAEPPPGGLPVAASVLPLALVALLHGSEPEPSATEPAYMSGLERPPGYRLWQRSATEDRERAAYGTPWLINATFTADGTASGRPWFQLFSYLTRSRSHLSVHQISNCLDVPGQSVRYGPPVVVDGRRWFTFQIDADGGRRQHGYFAFWVDGEHHDDKLATQLEVFRRRLLHGVDEVGLTRLLMPGSLELPPSETDRAILRWRSTRLGAMPGR